MIADADVRSAKADLINGLEGVTDVLHLWAAPVGPGDGDDVEAGGMVEKPATLEVGGSQNGETALLRPIDRFGGMALVAGPAGFYFDEDDRAAVDGNQVQLSQAGTDAAADDAKTAAPQITSGCRFPSLAESSRADERLQPK